jgi:hypothetical protein
VRHKSVNTPLSHERPVARTRLAVYCGCPQPLYTASRVRATGRSWDRGVLTDLCLTLYMFRLCVTNNRLYAIHKAHLVQLMLCTEIIFVVRITCNIKICCLPKCIVSGYHTVGYPVWPINFKHLINVSIAVVFCLAVLQTAGEYSTLPLLVAHVM